MLRYAVPGNFVPGAWPAAARTAQEIFSLEYNYIKQFDVKLNSGKRFLPRLS